MITLPAGCACLFMLFFVCFPLFRSYIAAMRHCCTNSLPFDKVSKLSLLSLTRDFQKIIKHSIFDL